MALEVGFLGMEELVNMKLISLGCYQPEMQGGSSLLDPCYLLLVPIGADKHSNLLCLGGYLSLVAFGADKHK